MINVDELIASSIKNKDSLKANLFRSLKNEILKYKTAKNAKPYDEKAECSILQKLISQHKDSIEQFKQANRKDLELKEQEELDILTTLLPKQASEMELNTSLLEVCTKNDIDVNVNYAEFIPTNKMGIIIKTLKDMFPQNDPAQIFKLVKLHLIQ